ncbi:MAG: ABC transporter ATP-binding protein [Microbacteriaceae bacterium]|nr:MAG: ABC transporter ATP-binding protein [Microbacteriaceae bacterium]
MSPAKRTEMDGGSGDTSPSAAAVVLKDLSKSYGSVHAVRSASLQLMPGQVTAIVGENGAGKSTLVKMLAGVEAPDEGTISMQGRQVRFRSARDAAVAGIGMVFQETALVPQLTVWENVSLGWETSSRLRGIDKRASLKRLAAIARDYGLAVPAERRIRGLPVSMQQQVEILKVLYREAEVIILDEPTGVLTPQEARGLFKAIRVLRDAGKAVIFISHKLNEVLEISDIIYVMRAGEVVASAAPGQMAPRDLAHLMLGNELPIVERSKPKSGLATVLTMNKLVCSKFGSADQMIGPINLELTAGTVLGVAGVAGSGQDEFIATLTGLRAPAEGGILFHGNAAVSLEPGNAQSQSVRTLRNAGMAYVPSDRGSVATLSSRPLWISAIAGRQRSPRFDWHGFVRRKSAREFARQIIRDGQVKAHSVESLPGSLSGGNLQKFIVARELADQPLLLIAEEPTRGIDVGSAVMIRQQIRDLASRGCAVVAASTDLDELMDISDRIVVFFDGSIVAEMERNDATVELVGAAMTGLTRAESQS